jgi:site-specific recombinase XerD
MEAEQMRQLLDSIPIVRKIKVPRKHGGGHKEVADLKGLRDRVVIAIMAYTFATFARVSAVLRLTSGDYRIEGKRSRLGLMEKGNQVKLVRLHREAEEFLNAYINAYIKEAGIEYAETSLFQTLDKAHRLTGEAITRRDMLRVVKERCIAAELSEDLCNHTFRGTGITVCLHKWWRAGSGAGHGKSLGPADDETLRPAEGLGAAE